MDARAVLTAIRDRLPGGKRILAFRKSIQLYKNNRDIPFYKNQIILNIKAYFLLNHYGAMLYRKKDECPDELYHVTKRCCLPGIRKDGLNNSKTSVIFLTDSIEYLSMISSMREDPVVLRIDAKRMRGDGFHFFQRESNPSVWITYNVPTAYISMR